MSFLGLPLEVRFMIYAYLRPPVHRLDIRELSAPSILLTCKSAQTEIFTCWRNSWPPTVEIQLAEINTGLDYPSYRPYEGPTWQPEKDFRKIGRATISQIKWVRLIGHSRVEGTQATNKPWLTDKNVSVQIEYGVKYLVRYFTGLRFVDIHYNNWQAHLWEPALRRLIYCVDSILLVDFSLRNFCNADPALHQAHCELYKKLMDLLTKRRDKRHSDCLSSLQAKRVRIYE